MNRMLLLFGALLGAVLQIQAQGHSVPDAVLEDHRRVVPGEIVVKFIDDVDCDVVYDNMGKALSAFDVQAFLPEGVVVAESKVLFDKKSIDRSLDHKAELAAKSTKTPQEMSMKGISLKNVFQVKLELPEEGAGPDPTRNVLAALNENPLVEYAEPNYIYELDDFEVGKTWTEAELIEAMPAMPFPPSSEAPNDPLYANQPHLGLVHMQDVWENYTTGDTSQVIAILDTGVDYLHPDLAANTWVNEAELNGIEGYDDDGNGYIDDVHGWDFINADNAPLDDNVHGTHVAGIAAAVTNNEIGIAGASWNARIMPIKVLQSTGSGNSTDVAAGIMYAANNGATVINLSLGSYGESSIMLSALENAYATSAIVASAGNDGIKIGPCLGCAPHYPSAYSFVMGVEDSPKPDAGYTNWDQDGPVFTQYANLLNYEVTTPGTQILSTVPNGGYAQLTGTSMAAPLMSACVALYQELKPEDSQELMFGSFINTSDVDYVNMLSVIETEPTPQLQVLSATFRDTIAGQNGNGYTESGEIIEILPLVKNYWGPSDDVRVGIAFAQYEDTSKADILVAEASLGSVSAYATLQNLDGGLQIRLDENVNNNVDIRFDVSVWSGTDSAYLSTEEIVVNVKNRILLSGLITEDLTLESGKEYLVVDNTVLGSGTHLEIEPGVTVYFSDEKSMKVFGTCNAEGTPGERISFRPENIGWNGLEVDNAAIFENCNFTLSIGRPVGGNGHVFKDCIWYDCGQNVLYGSGSAESCNIVERLSFHSQFSDSFGTGQSSGLNIVNNTPRYWEIAGVRFVPLGWNGTEGLNQSNIFNNWLNVPPPSKPISVQVNADITVENPNYYGSSNPEILEGAILDFFEDGNLGVAQFNVLQQPSAIAHGIVWKVLVNGLDAQDEYEALDPIGVGEHEFQVYFNRAMDVSVAPKLSYGVTIPYNQRQVSEEGTWSADSTVYTVTHEVGIGAADGISRIRVQDAVDNEGWTIPVEDSRFNMLVQSAGSASTGFFATPGLGKIELNWEAPSEELVGDLLGYNMYRYQVDTAGNELEVQLLNTALLTDETFVDFEVEEGEQYFYKYKILRTSFQETDFSSSVTASPLTALLGDSNGDFAVNVMDVIHDVDYILGMNPQPFIFNAADVNNDLMINVLDVVGTVDIILNPVAGGNTVNAMAGPNYYPNTPVGEVTLTWENGTLVAESQHAIAGLQLALEGTHEVTFPAALAGMEKMVYKQEGQTIVLLFNFANQGFDAGRTELFSIADGEAELDLTRASVANDGGAPLTPVFRSEVLRPTTSPAQNDGKDWLVSFPNPASDAVQLEYCLPRTVEQVDLVVYNAQGAVVAQQSNLRNTPGISAHTLDVSSWQSGNYVAVLRGIQGRHVVCHQVERLAVR